MRVLAVLALLLASASAGAAEPPRLGLPLKCNPGVDCWVGNYPDADPGPAAKDFRCRPRSYQNHDGTDLAVRDRKAMEAGMPVLAVAAGRVVHSRDGDDDFLWVTGRKDEVLAIRHECGNRATIDLGDGWLANYCHMKKGSVSVKVGDMVQAGQPIGMLGMSGMTEFPHVHVGITHGPDVVDPFTGAALSQGCGQKEKPLWAVDFPYGGITLYALGFEDHVRSREESLADGAARQSLPADAANLVLWADIFGMDAGDMIRIRIVTPDGGVLFDAQQRWEKAQALIRPAGSKPRPSGGWPKGTYRGEITLTRPGEAPQIHTTQVTIR